MNQFPLAADCFNEEERTAVNEVMASGFYSMGKKVKQFEKAFAEFVGAKQAVMVNSGSSANLLLIAALLNRTDNQAPLRPGDEVLVPALSWPTTVWPLSQLGLVPVFVDIDSETLAISTASAEKALSPKTKAMFLIHVLGKSANMDEIEQFCEKNKILLVEDCCESFGSYYNGKHVGRFGQSGSFSHFFSHHLTTMEGGTIVTDDVALADDLRSLRAHGWIRDRHDKDSVKNQYPHLDPRFLFLLPGFNVRPMEIQGAVGLVQLKKVEDYLRNRDQLAKSVHERTKALPWLNMLGADALPATNYYEDKTERTHSWMNIPFVVAEDSPVSVTKVKEVMESCGIETRPIIAGNLTKHPAIEHIQCRVDVPLEVSDSLLERGFMIGCAPINNNDDSLQSVEKAVEALSKL